MNGLLHIRRVVILGNSGFIGGHVERIFREHSLGLEIVGKSSPEIDLTRMADAERLAPLMDEHTAVIMCAGIKKQLGDSLDTFSQNVGMARNLCKLLEHRPVGKFVFFSSAAVYGEDVEHGVITEQTPVHPTSYYGLAKYVSERLFCKTFADQRPTPRATLVILRPALVYGPRDPAGGYGPSGFIRAALRREPISLWGDGSERREFVFVEDAARIVHRLSFHSYSGVYNLVSGTSYTFRDAVNIVGRLVGRSLRVTSRPRNKDRVDHRYDNRALLGQMGHMQFTSLEEGMRRTLESAVREASRPEAAVSGCSS